MVDNAKRNTFVGYIYHMQIKPQIAYGPTNHLLLLHIYYADVRVASTFLFNCRLLKQEEHFPASQQQRHWDWSELIEGRMQPNTKKFCSRANIQVITIIFQLEMQQCSKMCKRWRGLYAFRSYCNHPGDCSHNSALPVLSFVQMEQLDIPSPLREHSQWSAAESDAYWYKSNSTMRSLICACHTEPLSKDVLDVGAAGATVQYILPKKKGWKHRDISSKMRIRWKALPQNGRKGEFIMWCCWYFIQFKTSELGSHTVRG